MFSMFIEFPFCFPNVDSNLHCLQQCARTPLLQYLLCSVGFLIIGVCYLIVALISISLTIGDVLSQVFVCLPLKTILGLTLF